MLKKMGLVLGLTVALVAGAAFLVAPAEVKGEEAPDQEPVQNEPVKMEGEFCEKMEERISLKLERIKELKEEGLLTEEKAEESTVALEEKSSHTRGDCPEDGPRNCEIRLNLRAQREANQQEARQQEQQEQQGFRNGR